MLPLLLPSQFCMQCNQCLEYVKKESLGKTFSFTYTKASTQLLDLKQALKLIHMGVMQEIY